MKPLSYLVFFLFFSPSIFSQQDIEVIVTPFIYPPVNTSSCSLGSSGDHIRMTIKNNSGSLTNFGEYIYLGYQIDAGPIRRDSIPTLAGNATWQFEFNEDEDFTNCDDTFNIVTWVEYQSDPNNTNDTFAYQFIDYCDTDAGTLLNDSIYFDLGALDTLTLVNSQNSDLIQWYYSSDSVNWNSINSINSYIPISYQDPIRYYLAKTSRIISGNLYCPDTSNVVRIQYLDTSLGMEQDFFSDLKFYPNPAMSFLNLEGVESVEIQIKDFKGKEIKRVYSSKNTLKVDLTDMESGVYILCFYKSSHRITRKLIIP